MITKTPIKLVIFDNDGTLMDTENIYSQAHKEATGQEITWDLKQKLMGKIAIESARTTVEYLKLNETPESFLARRTKIEDGLWATVPLLKGAEWIVDELLKRKIKIAIATAADKESFALKSSRHKDFVAKFERVVCGCEVEKGKPAPDLFLKALSYFDGIKPEECIVFEDSALGIKAANSAGMTAIFVPDPNVNAEQWLKDVSARADVQLESLDKFNFDLFYWSS